MPHTFPHLFGPARDVIALDIVEPTHSEAIGLVLSDRDPQSPIASALLASTLEADFATATAGLPM